MTQSLVINRKEYLPSSILATRFGYTPDYLGKLAREEKVLGTLIGRQWFIEPESLSVFLTQAEIAKKMRQEELRIQRRLERQTHQEKSYQARKAALQHELAALVQTAVVVICGLMLGTLGFVAAEAEVGPREFAGAAHETFSFVAQSVLPVDTAPLSPYTFVAATALGPSPVDTHQEMPLIFASLPVFPERERAVVSATVTQSAVVSSFSDEVRMLKSANGNDIIVPIFRSGEGESDFLLVPVNSDTYHE